MDELAQVDLPAALGRAQRKLQQWRQRHRRRTRIPDELWREAAELAGAYGINRIARALRLDYYSLKKRVEAAGGCRVFGQKVAPHSISDRRAIAADDQAMTGFIELAAASPTGSPECILELEDPGGAKMRVHLKGVEAPDLAALSRSFWSTTT